MSTRVERLVANYLSDAVLWPVVIAVVGHMAVLLAPFMLGLVRDGSPVGAVGLVGLGIPSVGLVRMGARINHLTGALAVVLGTWFTAAGMAWLANYYHFY